jgi:hypothetical protein
MKLDRARFLMLTSALAAACSRPSGVAAGGRPARAEVGTDADAGTPVVDVPEPAPVEAAREPEGELGSGSCNDMAGRVPSCSGMRLPGPTCEQGMNVPPEVCGALGRVFKPRVAAELVSCLVDRSQQGGRCGPDDWLGDCPVQALERLCNREPDVEGPCRQAVDRCSRARYGGKRLTDEQCVRFVSAIVPSARPEALTCVAEGCAVDHCFLAIAWGKL